MIATLTACVLTFLITSGPALPQQEGFRMMGGSEEQYNRLQAMRVWMIINALDLDPSTEKGIALLGVIKKYSDAQHQLIIRMQEILISLHQKVEQSTELDEAKIAELMLEYEQLHRDLRALKEEEDEKLVELLSPVERAKLLIAEEMFKERLRMAIRGHGGERPPYKH